MKNCLTFQNSSLLDTQTAPFSRNFRYGRKKAIIVVLDGNWKISLTRETLGFFAHKRTILKRS